MLTFHCGPCPFGVTTMNCMSLRILPKCTPFRYSSTKTVNTKFPVVVAVQLMVPVIGLIVMGFALLPGGMVKPAQGVFHPFKGEEMLQYKESPSGSKGKGLYCQGVFTGRKMAAGTRKNGVEFGIESTVKSVCKNILSDKGEDRF